MNRFAQWLAARLIADHDRIHDPAVREQYGRLEGWTSIWVNALLFVVRFSIGVAAGSIAIVADSVHTLTDCATSVIIVVGFVLAAKPSDRKHPFGHGRMELVASLVISVLLFVSAFELTKHSLGRAMHPQAGGVAMWVLLAVAVTFLIKLLLARFADALGDMIDSAALHADAAHHRADAVTTALVIVSLLASRFGLHHADGIGGLIVSGFIFYAAFMIARDAVSPLLGEAPSPDVLRRIETAAEAFEHVIGVHDIIVNDYVGKRLVSLHVEVPARFSATSLHDLAENVERAVGRELGAHVVVHVDPVSREHPQYAAVLSAITEVVERDPHVHAFHDLRLVAPDDTHVKAVFDIALADETPEEDARKVVTSLRRELSERLQDVEIVIKPEPKHTYTV